jgi:hypothetical protein
MQSYVGLILSQKAPFSKKNLLTVNQMFILNRLLLWFK